MRRTEHLFGKVVEAVDSLGTLNHVLLVSPFPIPPPVEVGDSDVVPHPE